MINNKENYNNYYKNYIRSEIQRKNQNNNEHNNQSKNKYSNKNIFQKTINNNQASNLIVPNTRLYKNQVIPNNRSLNNNNMLPLNQKYRKISNIQNNNYNLNNQNRKTINNNQLQNLNLISTKNRITSQSNNFYNKYNSNNSNQNYYEEYLNNKYLEDNVENIVDLYYANNKNMITPLDEKLLTQAEMMIYQIRSNTKKDGKIVEYTYKDINGKEQKGKKVPLTEEMFKDSFYSFLKLTKNINEKIEIPAIKKEIERQISILNNKYEIASKNIATDVEAKEEILNLTSVAEALFMITYYINGKTKSDDIDKITTPLDLIYYMKTVDYVGKLGIHNISKINQKVSEKKSMYYIPRIADQFNKIEKLIAKINKYVYIAEQAATDYFKEREYEKEIIEAFKRELKLLNATSVKQHIKSENLTTLDNQILNHIKNNVYEIRKNSKNKSFKETIIEFINEITKIANEIKNEDILEEISKQIGNIIKDCSMLKKIYNVHNEKYKKFILIENLEILYMITNYISIKIYSNDEDKIYTPYKLIKFLRSANSIRELYSEKFDEIAKRIHENRSKENNNIKIDKKILKMLIIMEQYCNQANTKALGISE